MTSYDTVSDGAEKEEAKEKSGRLRVAEALRVKAAFPGDHRRRLLKALLFGDRHN